jgi:hypothetical protein
MRGFGYIICGTITLKKQKNPKLGARASARLATTNTLHPSFPSSMAIVLPIPG